MLSNRDTNTIFSMISKPNVPMSSFTQRFRSTMTMNENYIVPIRTIEIVPGDTLDLDVANFSRLMTLKTPFMDNVYMDVMAFFCPYRILWKNFKKMMGEQNTPDEDINVSVPTVRIPEITPGQSAADDETLALIDYLGANPYATNYELSSLYFRAYNKIYNEWFRDENLIDSVVDEYESDSSDISNYKLLKRGKRKDYFTSALPYPQKNNVTVTLPLGTQAPIVAGTELNELGNHLSFGSDGTANAWFNLVQHPLSSSVQLADLISGESVHNNYITSSNLYADLSEATASTIMALRQAIALQVFYERCNISGTRYTEMIEGFFGISNPDARLQRPEFLGGKTLNLNMNAVPQTSATSSVSSDKISPQGNLAAYATIGEGSQRLFKKSFTEYGCVMIFANIRADLTYQQGIPRFFDMKSRLDFYNPTFAHLSEQIINQSEIYATGVDTNDKKVFGYQERDAQYRYMQNTIAGKLRSQDPQSLDYWHLAQELDENVALNADFINENVPIQRVVAVQNEPHFLCDFQFTTVFTRPLPLYGTPLTFGL